MAVVGSVQCNAHNGRAASAACSASHTMAGLHQCRPVPGGQQPHEFAAMHLWRGSTDCKNCSFRTQLYSCICQRRLRAAPDLTGRPRAHR